MAHPGKEISGLQRYGHNSHGESSYVEADPNSSPVQRCDILLCCREDKVYDEMEAGMDGVQGSFEEDGMKYGGGSHDEF